MKRREKEQVSHQAYLNVFFPLFHSCISLPDHQTFFTSCFTSWMLSHATVSHGLRGSFYLNSSSSRTKFSREERQRTTSQRDNQSFVVAAKCISSEKNNKMKKTSGTRIHHFTIYYETVIDDSRLSGKVDLFSRLKAMASAVVASFLIHRMTNCGYNSHLKCSQYPS